MFDRNGIQRLIYCVLYLGLPLFRISYHCYLGVEEGRGVGSGPLPGGSGGVG